MKLGLLSTDNPGMVIMVENVSNLPRNVRLEAIIYFK